LTNAIFTQWIGLTLNASSAVIDARPDLAPTSVGKSNAASRATEGRPAKLRPRRSSGILLHPSSLPSHEGVADLGIGDLGPGAYAWIDSLAEAGQSWWQVLPLGPVGPTASPYQSASAFAGNPLLVSVELLARDGLIARQDIPSLPLPRHTVDYGAVVPLKTSLLDRASDTFRDRARGLIRDEFDQFVTENSHWLEDYALFMALKEAHHGRSWQEWPDDLRRRDPRVLAEARRSLADAMHRQRFHQFAFFRQWFALKEHARKRQVRIIGDVPIFVNGDSADVWANPHLFLLDAEGRQTVQAGVPPDYFAKDGQLWGNPLYDWRAMAADDFAWWVARLRMVLRQVDLVRVDHFRGFAAAWHVPAGAPHARIGEWVPGPGVAFFESLRRQLGGLPLIAEDLGLITPDVIELRQAVGLPGMCVLQFAFGGDAENRYLPHNYEAHAVVYTGTHDNDTTWGWYNQSDEWVKDHVRRYLGRDGRDIAWDFIRAAWASTADLAIAPMQDVLNLGSEARMNTPGVPEGNWRWRIPPGTDWRGAFNRLRELTELYGRLP
jgi:4-alpha-glucanotransferase